MKIRVLRTDDWIRVRAESGEILHENHSVGTRDFLDILRALGHDVLDQREDDPIVFEDLLELDTELNG